MALHYRWALRICVLGIIAGTMGWLTFGRAGIFTSPDENANAFFAQTFAETGSMIANEPLNAVANGIIHPRSMIAPGTVILPVSFLGFPFITGILRSAFGIFGALMFTPMIAVCAVLALWWIVKRSVHDETLADLSALFLLTHPAFWYYGARVMMPNVAFVSLLIIGIACFFFAASKRSIAWGVVAGSVMTIGVAMRLVEIPVLLIVALIIGIAYRKSLPWKALCGAMIAGLGVFAVYLCVNSSLYGSALATGYTLPDVRSMSNGTSSPSALSSMMGLLFPFGIHLRAMMVHAFRYGWLLYPISSTLAVIGAWFAWTSKEHRKAWRVLVICLAAASVWMITVYGSWTIADNPDPKAITVGNSYVRYWLPLFAASSVLVAFAVRKMLVAPHRFVNIGVGCVVAVLLAMNTWTVFSGSDGLIATRAALLTFAEKRSVVVEYTESDAVVIVDRADKYLFPSRRVIVPLRSNTTYAAMPVIAPVAPLYYFGITFPDADIAYLNEEKLAALGLRIEYVVTVQDESLYRIRVSENL